MKQQKVYSTAQEYFTHRLGHCIGFEAHSEAVNLDGFETHDTRRIMPRHLLLHRTRHLPA
jgi:hypothetical protein